MELRRNSHYDGFETNFERDIKRLVQMDQFTDEVKSSFGQLAIEYKTGVRIFSLFTYRAHNIWCVAHYIYLFIIFFIIYYFIRLYLYLTWVRKHLFIRAFLKLISKSLIPDFRSENKVSFKEVQQQNKFERFVVFTTIRQKDKINFGSFCFPIT